MFKEIRKNVIESDEGFSVEVLGRAGIKYKEGSKTFYIDSEMEVGPYEMVIYKKRVRNWESPIGSYEAIDDKKKNEIVENIRRALFFQGRKIEIEELY